MAADIVDIRQHAPTSHISVEHASLMSEQGGQQINHADYVVIRLGAEAIALSPTQARELAAMIVEYADKTKAGASS